MRPLRHVTLAFVVLAAAALLAAGCGGPLSKAEYEKQVEKIGNKVDSSIDKLSPKADAPPSADDIAKAADSLNEAADELNRIEPPGDVAKAHGLMVKGLQHMASSFEKLANRLEGAKADKERMDTFFTFLNDKDAQKAIKELTEAQGLFAANGYKVFAPSSGSGSGGGDDSGGGSGSAPPGSEPPGGTPPDAGTAPKG